MIKTSHTFKAGTVFVRCSENDEEIKELNNLERQVIAICKKTQKTGLWIVIQFNLCNRTVLVTSLEKRVELSGAEIDLLRRKLLELFPEIGSISS